MRRLFELLAILVLAANVFILGRRVYYLIEGHTEGDFLLTRSIVEIIWSVAVIAYFVLRYRFRTI